MADDVEWNEKSPSFPWYAKDYLTDPQVLRCSWPAKGVWGTALSQMWLQPVKGHLECEDRAELCRVLGGSEAELSPLIDELINKKVASSNGPGSLINRRMFRQAKLKQTRSESGQIGGKKTAEKKKEIQRLAELAKANEQANGKPKEKQNGLPPSPSPSPSPTSTSVRTEETSVKADPNEELALFPGCKYFKISKHQRQLVKDWFSEKKFTHDLIIPMIQVIDAWMDNDESSIAVKARKSKTHFKRLYQSWVLERAIKDKKIIAEANGVLRPRSQQFVSQSERNQQFFEMEKEKLNGKNDENSDDGSIEASFERMAESSTDGDDT